MNKRQREVQQVYLDNEKKVLKKLEENYQDALDEVNNKIEQLMARQDADQQYVIYQIEFQKALKTQIQAILEQLQANEFETVSEYLAEAYEDGYIGTMYDLQGQGIPLVMPIDQEQVVAAIKHETQLSEDLYTALGKDIADLQKKIAGEISRGISSGQMSSEIARNIASWARIPKNNAMRIARTEAHRIQCQAAMDAQFKAKDKGADVVKQWSSVLDGKTRTSHRKLERQIRELEEPFEVNGHKAMMPGGFGIAKEDINCRCALLQRGRWALGNDYTKWSPDAPIVISDDGTAQLVTLKEKSYNAFKKKYQQLSMNLQFFASNDISSKDMKAIYDYISTKSYDLNEKLRKGFALSKDDKVLMSNLDKALDKMPAYEGNLQRSLYFYSDDAVATFMSTHTIGSKVTYKEYISASRGKTYNPDGQVQIFIQNAKKGKDISTINENEDEVIYKRDSSFVVTNVVEQDGKFYILVVEDDE